MPSFTTGDRSVMTYAFAKDSQACAVCVSWAGERSMSADMTLVEVARYAVEGECRTASSQDYRRVTRSYHTCGSWQALPLLKAHGARHSRTPGPSAAMEGMLAATPPKRRPPAAFPDAAATTPSAVASVPVSGEAGSAPAVVADAIADPPVTGAAARSGIRPPPPPASQSPLPVPPAPPLPSPSPSAPLLPPAPPPALRAPPPPRMAGEPVAAEDGGVACTSAPLDLDRSPPSAQVLHNYWQRLRGKRPMPAAPELDMVALRDTVGRLCLFALSADGSDFIYRACGRAVQRRFGRRLAGLALAAAHPPAVAQRLRQDLRACLDEGAARACLVSGDPLLPGQRFAELLLPLTDGVGRPALVLAYRDVRGG